MAASLVLTLLLGLVGISAGLWSQKLYFCSKMELNHLVVNETRGMVHLGSVSRTYQLSVGQRLLQDASLCESTLGNLATTAYIFLHVRTWKAFPVTPQEPIFRLVWMSWRKRNRREKSTNYFFKTSWCSFHLSFPSCLYRLYSFVLFSFGLFECLSFSSFLTCSIHY